MAADRVDSKTAKRLAPYRAGYTPQQRRDIEQRLVAGDLLGVSCTDALELGIDIGLLDCAISVGFPGTVASLRQQWGRAGRRGHGLAVLVASEDALDQYFMREPETLLGRRVEAAILDHSNPRVLDGHVAPQPSKRRSTTPTVRRWETRRSSVRRTSPSCSTRRAAGSGQARIPGRTHVAALDDRRRVHGHRRDDGIAHGHRRARAGVLDRAQGRHLPPPGRAVARARPRPARRHAIVDPSRATGTRRSRRRRRPTSRSRCASSAAWARAHVRPRLGDRAGRRVPAQDHPRPVDDRHRPARPPATTFDTEAVWYVPSARHLDGLEAMPTLLSSLHAAEHSMIALLPLWAMCDRWTLAVSRRTSTRTRARRRSSSTTGTRRRRDRGAGLRPVRGLGRGHRAHAAGMPVRARLPSCVQSPKAATSTSG